MSKSSGKTLYLKHFHTINYVTLVTKTTHSTWVERTVLTSPDTRSFSETKRLTSHIPVNINSSWK